MKRYFNMKRIFSLLTLLFLSCLVYAEKHTHVDEYEVRYVKKNKKMDMNSKTNNIFKIMCDDKPGKFWDEEHGGES